MRTCDERDRENDTYKGFSKLIIEVLADSTEAFDRGDKFADYPTLATLEEYVLINTRHQRVECFQRNEAGLWVLRYHTERKFALASLNFSAPLADLYENVKLGQTPETAQAR